ncbi:MAG: phosphoadenylyl-sulfate reductase [Fimbriimonas sp.]|nr:phosphoadenylyl-sulfate reductase [Fimbriimonas sp.]
MSQPTSDSVLLLQARFDQASAEEILRWGDREFGGDLTLACSFGAEDVVLLDIRSKLGLATPVFVLDTGRLHEETYDTMRRCQERYVIEFQVYAPDTARLQSLIRSKGPFSFYESFDNRKECCGIRKVEPLRRALDGRRAWVTGLRREQSVTREGLPKVELDEAHNGIFKMNPLADWAEDQVWNYIRANDVPYNALHDRGYPSIGCAPCTRAIQPGEHPRAGRWWWEQPEHKECGLHLRAIDLKERRAR